MKQNILTHVAPDWRNGIDRFEYKLFDLRRPHCDQARQYRDSHGMVR